MKIKHSKRLVLISIILMVLVAIGLITTVVAQESDPTLRVKSFALTLENNVCMDFKVSHTNVSDASDIQLLVWTDVPTEYKKGTEDYALTSKGSESSGVEVFQYENFAAKQMTEMIYVCAYVEQNGTETYSSPAKFSIAMYAYLKRNAANPDTQLVELLDSMLEYGAMSQKYFNYNLDFLATDELCQVTVVNGKLSDGFTKGWYKKGTEIVLTADAPAEGYEFSHWETSTGDVIESDTVIVTNVAETYTAVYTVALPPYSDGLEYALFEEDTYVVTGVGTVTSTDIVIPSVYNGKPVIGIGAYAFADRTDLTSITIPDGLKIIGANAFFGCSSLTSINFPDSLTDIYSFAFMRCSSLTSVVLPNNVTYIDSALFSECNGLTSINIPEGVEKIKFGAFSGCINMTSVIIPSSLTSIAAEVFYQCSGLTTVYFNGTADDWAGIIIDSENTNLTNATRYYYSETQPTTTGNYWRYVNGVPTVWAPTSDKYFTFTELEDGTYSIAAKDVNDMPAEVIIPSTYNGKAVTSIGSSAFNNCRSLKSITIPDSVTSIGERAFDGCSNLIQIEKGVSYVDRWVIDFNNDYFGPGVYPKKVTWRDNTVGIGNQAFFDCNRIDQIIIPDSVKYIGEYAFSGCTGMEDIVIPDGVTSIANSAFARCYELTNFVIPDGVTSIGSSAFSNCSGLTSIVIPDSVTSIGGGAFSYCSGLTSIVIPDSVTSIGNYAFYGCRSLKSITIPDSVTSIGKEVFRFCDSLTSITIPFVGETLDDSVNTHLGYLFGADSHVVNNEYVPKSLKTVVITGGASIGQSAFSSCSGLTSITIPDSVTSIGKSAFSNCDNLASVTIGNSVISIEYGAFSFCSSLKTVYYGGTAEDWAKISIGSDNTKLTNATRYYYSETQPTTTGNYWHYVEGVPTKW